MRKWIIVLVLILIVFINPSKLGIFNKSDVVGDKIREIKGIEVESTSRYHEYKDGLVLYKDNKILLLDDKGKIKFSVDKKMNDYQIFSNYYIDVIDKDNGLVFSINEAGKFIFNEKIPYETLVYKSIDKYTFVIVYNKDDNNYIRIQDSSGDIMKEFEHKGKITDIEVVEDNILVVDIETENNLQSKISLYNKNGNVIKNIKFDNIVMNSIVANGYIYLLFNNNVLVLDYNLNKKVDIKINGINHVSKSEDGHIYTIDSDKNLGVIYKVDYKTIKSRTEFKGIRSIANSYITYSESSIFNEKGKPIKEFKENIKDILVINENVIAVCFNNNIKFFEFN